MLKMSEREVRHASRLTGRILDHKDLGGPH